MQTPKRIIGITVCVALALLLENQLALAQKAAVPSRVTAQVDDTRTVRLEGNVHPMARPEFDRGALAESQPLTRMMLLLQRSPEQEAALRQVLDTQYDKSSPNYHAWLTPDQFGKQYGPSDGDVQAVMDWLTRQGFQVSKVATGRTAIEFSGNVAQVQNAFHTAMHKFAVNGQEHFANVSDPAIPAALAPVLRGVVALNNFPKQAHVRKVGTFQRNPATGQVTPEFTYTDLNGTFYGVGPADFAKIYNIPSGADGTGQKIAVIGQSNINPQDVCDFRNIFGLTPACPAYTTNNLQVIVNGPDPGLQAASGDENESALDVEWAGAVAPNAQIIFVTSLSTLSNPAQVSNGVDLSAVYAVDNNVAPVLSESYGLCEAFLGTTGNAFFYSLWEQAAAQGITVAVSAGDSGSAGCDSSLASNAASSGIAVSGIASTPFNVALGGTDFNQVGTWTTYWNATNTSPTQLSAKGYIPETPWDDSTCANKFPAACTVVDSTGLDLSAAGGGPSNCVQSTTSSSGVVTCTTNNSAFPSGGYPKPAWQTGPGLTPADLVRDIPDVSFFSSIGSTSRSFLIMCESDMNPNNAPCDLTTTANSSSHNFIAVGGTSAATPTFAGIIALVNQSQATAQNPAPQQGNANYVLYALAAADANYTSGNCKSAVPQTAGCVYNDLNVPGNANGVPWNNSVACIATGAINGSPNCSNSTSSGFGVLVSSVAAQHGQPAFQTVSGYDLATGLGSINVANLLTKWSTASRTPTTTTFSTAPSGGSPSGQPLTAAVTVATAPTGNAGTESVAITALASDKTTVLGSFGPFILNSSGTVNISGTSGANSLNLLPPGTAYVQATYGGDSLLAASSSSPVALSGTVAGANQASKTTVSFVTFDANNNPSTPSTGNQSVPYGSPYILQIAVTTSGGTSCAFGPPNTAPSIPCPTGTIALSDNGGPLNDFPNGTAANATNVAKLNNVGIVEDQPIQLGATIGTTTPGVHTITAAFTSGDTNYTSSSSNALQITISKATTSILVGSSLTSITSGQSVLLTAYVITSSNGDGPTQTVQFANGSTNLGSAVTCAPTSGAQNTSPPITQIPIGSAYCTATTTATISALYPPGSQRPKPPIVPVVPAIWALLSAALFAMGWRWMPENRRRAYALAGMVAFALLGVSIAGCGGGSGSSSGGKIVTINATYSGDNNYLKSPTGSVLITVH